MQNYGKAQDLNNYCKKANKSKKLTLIIINHFAIYLKKPKNIFFYSINKYSPNN